MNVVNFPGIITLVVMTVTGVMTIRQAVYA